MLLIHDLRERQNKRVVRQASRSFPVSAERTPRGFCYSLSSRKAEGSMSMIESSAILTVSLAASGFSLVPVGTDSDHGISESG